MDRKKMMNTHIETVKKIMNERNTTIRSDFMVADYRSALEKLLFEEDVIPELGIMERMEIIDLVISAVKGYGSIEHLIEDEDVNEIMVNGLDEVLVESRGVISGSGVAFENSEELMAFVQQIASSANRLINQSQPIADIRLQSGERVNVILPPVAINGPIVTIRKARSRIVELNAFMANTSTGSEIEAFLKEIVNKRYNVFICGGTSSGKTTLLSSLAATIPDDERVITIEDSAEIIINHLRNLVRLETRNANMEGVGAIDMGVLIRSALRMRPDRILVGEVRGGEAFEMLQAMNTGHDGSLSTGHANSNRDMLYRLETMILAARNMPIEAIKRQIVTGIDILVNVRREKDGKRRIGQIQYLEGMDESGYVLRDIFDRSRNGEVYFDKSFETMDRFLQDK